MNGRLRIEQPRSVAIVMLSALGDAVHVLPVVNALKRHWPAARLTWVIQPVPHRLVDGHEHVDEFVLFHRRRGVRGARGFIDLRRAVAGRRFDLVVNLQVYFKAGVITSILDAPVKLGFDRKRARDLNWLFTTDRIPPHATQHVQDQYLEFVQHLGIEPRPIEWRIPITYGERQAQQAWLARQERPACAVVVGTSKPEKNWAPERYARLLEAIRGDFGLQPVIVGGPSAVERRLAAEVKALARTEVQDELGDDIRRLVWLLDAARLVVSPDTGPLHVANALGRPLVGLYGYTNPRRYAPYGRPDAVVDGYARYPGEPYRASMEYRPEGMSRVTVEAALAVVERQLASPAGPGTDPPAVAP